MWKYVSRRIKDTFERSANQFVERRSAAGVINTSHNGNYDDNNKSNSPCKWFSSKKCWNSFDLNNTNSKRCNYDYISRTWMGAITWSSALVLGWYASQLINLKHKYHNREKFKQRNSVNNFAFSFYPCIKHLSKKTINTNSISKIEKVIENFTPTVHLISNEQNGEKKSVSTHSGSSTSPDTSDSELGDVLNSIENRLGLAAIESGQHKEGLNLLRSAANRNHAPAIYNLGLCYETGLGVKVDEKCAMEFYRTAAALDHPDALYNLGIYYGQGRGGLTRNTEIATRLLRLAAVQGQTDAINALKVLEVDTTEPPLQKLEPWSNAKSYYTPYIHTDSVIPSHTTLFVGNVHFLPENQGVY